MGLLGCAGAGTCPNLLQRRSAARSAARRSAEYQRFSSRAPARSEPLQQIWTTCRRGPSGKDGRESDCDHDGHPDDRTGPREGHSARASTSLNPRERTSGRRARGLSDDLVGYPTCSRVIRRARGPRRRPAPGAPDAERCTSHSKVQFQPSFSSAKCTSRVQNALLGEETGRSWSSQTAAPIPPRSISSDPTRKGH